MKGIAHRSTRRIREAGASAATSVIEAWWSRLSGRGDRARTERRGSQIPLADHRLAGGVAPAHASGHHHERGQPLAVEAERVIETGPQHRRWAPVVLRGAEHHDGVHRLPLVELTEDQDHDERGGIDHGGGEERAES